MKSIIATLSVLFVTFSLVALEQENKSGAGTFVSFRDGTLTIRGKSELHIYKQIGDNYKTYQNNDNGPGSRLVDTVDALSRCTQGTVFQVNVEDRVIIFGLDHRVIGTLESFADGKLNLLAADVPTGFVKKPAGNITLTIDPNTPVLESVDGSDLKFVGIAGDVLKKAKKGVLITARSEYDPAIVEVIEIGDPKRRIERYIGQTRGTVRGTFVSFKAGILRIRGKSVTPLAANEYERVIAARVPDHIPIVESIDGGEYQPTTADALANLKEGTLVTIRKVEEVLIEIRIGVPKKK